MENINIRELLEKALTFADIVGTQYIRSLVQGSSRDRRISELSVRPINRALSGPIEVLPKPKKGEPYYNRNGCYVLLVEKLNHYNCLGAVEFDVAEVANPLYREGGQYAKTCFEITGYNIIPRYSTIPEDVVNRWNIHVYKNNLSRLAEKLDRKELTIDETRQICDDIASTVFRLRRELNKLA